MELLKGYRIILVRGNLPWILFKAYTFYLYDHNKPIQRIAAIKVPLYIKIASRFRLLKKVFRINIRAMAMLSEDTMVFSFLGRVYLLNLTSSSITILQEKKRGFSSALNFCSASTNSEQRVYWGDYGSNRSHDKVNIYSVSKKMDIRIEFFFESKTIRHIHNIIWNEHLNRFFVLTGDFESQSGIYSAKASFKNVAPILIGKQDYRSVAAFPTKEGLIYATDSPSHQNHLFDLNCKENESPKLTVLTELNGPCIYGSKTALGYIFATSVESEEVPSNLLSKKLALGIKLHNLLSKKLAPGIKLPESHLLFVDHNKSSRIIARFEKDRLPIKLFGYGNVMFPLGNELIINGFHCYPVSVKKNDNKNLFLPLDEQQN